MIIASATLVAVLLLITGVILLINAEPDGLTLTIALGCCVISLVAAFSAGRYSL
jgi:hypothetical protein